MGGKYPTNSARAVPIGRPVGRPDYPGPVHRPRRPLPRVRPLNPYRPPARFPNGWKPPVKPFGRRPPINWPGGTAPGRFPLGRLTPWLTVGAFILPYIVTPTRVNLDGWRCCFDVGPVKDAFKLTTNACTPSFANLGYQVPTGAIADLYIGATTTSIFLGQYLQPSLIRMTHKAQYVRGTSGVVGPIPAPIKIIPPFWLSPWWELPPYRPWDWTPISPVPYRPPLHRPVWQPHPEDNPQVYPKPREVGNDLPVTQPDKTPDTETVITPTKVRTRTRQHWRRPPRTRDRERKYKMSGRGWNLLGQILLRYASRTYGGVTEVVDLLSAIYSALPDRLIAQHPDIPKGEVIPFMLGQIYENFDQIDIGEAIYNIAANQIEDAAWGAYFRASRFVSEHGPNYDGFDRENSELQRQLQELLRETQNQ